MNKPIRFTAVIEDSKESEIAFLAKLREAVKGEDLYISRLFTARLIEQCTSDIRDDILPDVQFELDYAADKLREAYSEIARLTKELADANEAKERYRLEYLENLGTLNHLSRKLKSIREIL